MLSAGLDKFLEARQRVWKDETLYRDLYKVFPESALPSSSHSSLVSCIARGLLERGLNYRLKATTRPGRSQKASGHSFFYVR